MGSASSASNGGFHKAVVGIHEGTRCRVKDLEKARVFGEICGAPETGTTRTGVIKKLSLRPTSVSHYVKELVDDRLVLERQDTGPRKQGRPEITLLPNRARFVAIAVHTTSRTLRAYLVNAFEEILAEAEIFLEETTTNKDFILKFSSVTEAIRNSVPRNSKLLGICLSVPGFMDTEKRQWVFAARWPFIKRLKFEDLEKIAAAPLVLSRALDTGLEYLLARDERLEKGDALLVHWGYGIGASYANAGKVMSSSLGGVCEFGHWKVRDDEPKACTCGARGCLETEAALWSLAPLLREEYPDAPEQEELFYDYFNKHGSMAEHPVFRRAVAAVGKGIAMLFVTLFPKKVLVYGPLTLIPEIRKTLKQEAIENLPDFARPYFTIDFLGTAYRGERLGSTRKLFLDEYRRHLRVKER